MDESLALSALATASLGALAWTLPKARRRLQLSRAKHRSLAGHSKLAKRIAGWIPGYAYDEQRFFDSDGAPPEVVALDYAPWIFGGFGAAHGACLGGAMALAARQPQEWQAAYRLGQQLPRPPIQQTW